MKNNNIKLETKQNIRDLSYLNNIIKNPIKENMLIRSNSISDFTVNDINILKNEKYLKTVIDIRDKQEVLKKQYKINNIK